MSTVEHIVLLNVKPDVDSTKVATMIDEIHSLASLNLTVHLNIGPVLRCASTSLNFSHLVYARFSSTDDLQPKDKRVHALIDLCADCLVLCALCPRLDAKLLSSRGSHWKQPLYSYGIEAYNYHPDHTRVAKSAQQVFGDVMAVDWISNGITDPLKPGSVMRVTLLKLTEDLTHLDENEKGKVVEGIISELKTTEQNQQMSVGEDITRVMAKGYSIGMIAVFPDLKALDSDVELANLRGSKVKEFVESAVVVDYVVPLL